MVNHLMGLRNMRIAYIGRKVILLAICLMLLSGAASAVRSTSAQFDKTGLTTMIDAKCIGTTIVQHDMDWEQNNIAGGNLANATLAAGETRADFTYRENTLATAGTTRYTKDFNMDGSNVSNGQDNLDVAHSITYQGDPAQSGKMLYDEQGTVQVYGSAKNSTSTTQCTFAAGGSAGQAGYRAVTTAGSTMDVSEVAAVTTMGARAISGDEQTPVNLRYGFDAAGIQNSTNNGYANGSAEVYGSTSVEVSDTQNTNLTTRIDDRQRTVQRGLFDLAQTMGYKSTT
jgi:hypothetical protein